MVRKSCSTGILSTSNIKPFWANSFAPILQRSLSSQLGGPNVWQTFHAPQFEFSIVSAFSVNFRWIFIQTLIFWILYAQKGWKSQVPLASLFTQVPLGLPEVRCWRLVAGALIQRVRKGVWTMTRNAIWWFGAWNMAGFIPGVMPEAQILTQCFPLKCARSPNQE